MEIGTAEQNRQSAESGFLRLDGALITYTLQPRGSFSLPLSEVAVIGEFTTADGPFIDDWYLVFVSRSGKEWFGASMYAAGSEDFRRELGAALGASLVLGLATSVEFASRVLWPAVIAGRPLFTANPVAASGFFRRIKLSLLPEISLPLSPEVLSAIG